MKKSGITTKILGEKQVEFADNSIICTNLTLNPT